VATLLAGMRDTEGRILIPGMSEAVRPLTATERAALDAARPRQTMPSPSRWRSDGASTRADGWSMPSRLQR